MNRSESDLRDALTTLEQDADRDGAPPASVLIAAAKRDKPSATVHVLRSRWLPPLAAAALVAASVVTVTLALKGSDDEAAPAGPSPSTNQSAYPSSWKTPSKTYHVSSADLPVRVLSDAAAKLDDASWKPPAPNQFFYVHTTNVKAWTSVSGKKSGQVRNSAGTSRGAVPGCVGGHFTAGSGQAGPCTLNDVGHYRADAPVAPNAWDQYLETMAPGAKAGGAQGKIIVQVLHTLDVKPVGGRKLVGVTCTSMSAGSYGLAFDATTHAYVGFVLVNQQGKQDDTAEIILKTAIVSRAGQKP